jgi:hypothetical protein
VGYVCGIELMEIVGAQVRELIDDRHDINFDCAPTSFN